VTDRLEALQAMVDAVAGQMESVRPHRDAGPPVSRDAQFVVNSARDLERLIACLRGELSLTDEELDEIEERCRRAAPAPWALFLEADGGLAGCNLIWFGDPIEDPFGPDIYLWQGDTLAPDPVWKLVVAARNEIRELVAAARAARG
jgi:hypothetical protein